MREETRYICTYCESAYSTPEECEKCESSHELPIEISEFNFNKNSTKYPKSITIKTANNRFALYQYSKPIVPTTNEGE